MTARERAPVSSFWKVRKAVFFFRAGGAPAFPFTDDRFDDFSAGSGSEERPGRRCVVGKSASSFFFLLRSIRFAELMEDNAKEAGKQIPVYLRAYVEVD